MSKNWMELIRSFVLQRRSGKKLNEGKQFMRCGTMMVYSGELKLRPECLLDSTPDEHPEPSKNA